jgi:serine/threonine protein kinase
MEDQRLVQLALDHRFITIQQVEAAKHEQQQLADRGVERSLWFLLLDLGYVSDAQSRELRKHVSSSTIRALEVDGWVLQGRIGSGGMGDVFRARNADGAEAAVKLLSSKLGRNPEHAKRFEREARAGLRLVHPHSVRSLSAGEVDGQRYLVMELAKGCSLKQRIVDGGKMSEPEAVVLIWQMASALGYAWGHGVLHRDVKPANLMITPPRPGVDEPFCAKLCDFGLAKVWQQSDGDHESTGQLTGTGMALGTPHYMAPEQASGERDLDQRADIYSLGASVYHALLGQTMHSGKSSTVIMYKQVTEAVDLKPLREAGISPAFIKLIGRMVDKSRKHRFATWDEVMAAARQLAPEAIARQEAALSAARAASGQPEPPPAARPTTQRSNAEVGDSRSSSNVQIRPSVKLVRKHHAWGVGAGVAVAILIAAAAAAWLLGRPSAQRVTPATFAVVLAGAGQRDHLDLLLEPGDYPGPWRFGVAHAGLSLHAGGAGVRLSGHGLDAGTALLQLEPGLRDFRLSGVALVEVPGTAVEALVGAQATLQNLEVGGAVVISGADLSCSGLRVDGAGIRVESRGKLRLEDSLVKGPCALDLRDGSAELHRCWLSGAAAPGGVPGEVVRAMSGRLDLDAVLVTTPDPQGAGYAAGIVLQSGAACTIHDVSINHVPVGLRADDAQLTTVDGLTIAGTRTGVSWTGVRDPRWSWTRMLVQAPQPVLGQLQLGASAEGARADRLCQVPAAAPAAAR